MSPPAAAATSEVDHGSRESPLAWLRSLAVELGVGRDGRRWLIRGAATVLTVGAGVLLAAALLGSGGLAGALGRAAAADWRWVLAAAALECASVAGYVALLHRVVCSASTRLSWRDSYNLSVGGTAAARLLPTAGLGGVALTVWALRALGISRRELTERLIALLVVLYSVYLAALGVSGIAVASGLGAAPRGSALGLAAALVAGATLLTLVAATLIPGTPFRDTSQVGRSPKSPAGVLEKAAGAVALVRAGLPRALGEFRRPRLALLGALSWWAFDIGVLWSMSHAFGAQPSVSVLALAYFAGTMCNLIPLPGSLSGGLAGSLMALGAAPIAAIPAVLAYRAIAIWLPAGAGLPSLVALRRAVARWRTTAHATGVRHEQSAALRRPRAHAAGAARAESATVDGPAPGSANIKRLHRDGRRVLVPLEPGARNRQSSTDI